MARRKQDLEQTPVMPGGFLPLSHPTAVTTPPTGAGWAHEIKLDGWRMQLNVGGGRARWFTRNGHDWTDRLDILTVFAGELPDCILDGELCALDEQGRPSFSALQSAMAGDRTEDLVFFAFDILFRGVDDLRPYATETRKAALRRVLDEAGPAVEDRLRYVEQLPAASSRDLHCAACRMQLEGIVSKRLDENYRPGRTQVWLKSKCRPSQELVIGGWKSSASGGFKGLLTGVFERDELLYAGSIKTGFGERVVRDLIPRLRSLERAGSPFAGRDQPRAVGRDRLHFVEPELVAQADIAEWTASGRIRQASFKGLREDKAPREVRRELPPTD